MKMYPSLETAKTYAQNKEYRMLPVCTELLADVRTPMQVLQAMKNVSSHCYLLESVQGHEQWGRYTFLGYEPTMEITCLNGEMKLGGVTIETMDPNRYIRQILKEYKTPRIQGMPPFTGGLVGYFSYDYLKYAEPTLQLNAQDNEHFQDVDLMLFDRVICFDHYRQKIILIVNISLDRLETEYNRAKLELDQMCRLVLNGEKKDEKPGRLKSEIRQLFTREQYCAMVEKAKHHIHEGDIFQIVLSNRL